MDSGAAFASVLNNTDNPASMTVSDGSKFSINDCIRCECYAEVYKVTNIVGNTLTLARAQFGTTMRHTYASGATVGRRILKMVSSIATDANGLAMNAEATLQRELWSGSGGVNYEDILVSGGNMHRQFFGPYALTVSKPGYKNYTAKILDPDENKFPLGPRTLEIALTPIGHPPAPWGYR